MHTIQKHLVTTQKHNQQIFLELVDGDFPILHKLKSMTFHSKLAQYNTVQYGIHFSFQISAKMKV